MKPRGHRRAVLAVLLSASVAGCGPLRADWGFEAIRSMPTPPDPDLVCGTDVSSDLASAARASCAFGPGARASQTLGIERSVLATIPIRHVIVLMKENRSFDHLLGRLHDLGQPGTEPIPAGYANPDRAGDEIPPLQATTTCMPWDPGHQASAVAACIDGDRMDGFVLNAAKTGTDGHFAMAGYGSADLPFYYWLAATFALGDRDFASMASGTFANRNFLLFGTNAGIVDSGIAFPPPNTRSLMQLLMNAGYTWGAYTDGEPLGGTLGWRAGDPGVHSMQELYDALDRGTLPNVAFVDGRGNVDDDHPPADLQRGEAWVRTLYDHAVASPQWQRLAIIWTYDEAGGFADHVPPEPHGCAPGDSHPTQRGPRVPLVVISPWARRGYVSHVVRDHAAITRFVEALFDLPALTARDANSDALLDMFDFSCGVRQPVPAAPAPGTGGCTR
jgi:phospholipase C